jgi:hypothetical protein
VRMACWENAELGLSATRGLVGEGAQAEARRQACWERVGYVEAVSAGDGGGGCEA